MVRQYLFTAACFFMIMGWTSGAVGQSIGEVDVRKIFQVSQQIKEINAQLEKKFAPQRENVIGLDKHLREDMKTFRREEAVMSKKESADFHDKIQKEQEELQKAQTIFQKRLYGEQNRAMSNFMGKILHAVKVVARKKNIDFVLPKDVVLYARDGKDVTPDVISELK
ncbi:OmpH family outer membrane protein [Coxiella endosymbiont of Amblyomma sculptum]|uniref:OmpH family outer membrane protein n=1 Tax=Coxiella endosymbiont of Amblyomma sculptum TaxID=2487929 RepID=UPI00132F3326|nr:OmpH family outer membrane protein [Coxiella endosymbiont of Amblyomma sculptum]QHG92341.1 OmpH family outer membrane protein [Coxiella endosymbiont of Amblyomma sculptum]